MGSGTSVQHRRIPTLDGWRAVAILGVLGTHTRWPAPWITRFFADGAWGVQLFFALSGFLITTRLLEEQDQTGAVNWRNFYLRRAFRILPPAFFVLGVLAILGLGFHLIPMSVDQLAGSAFFYRNYLFGTVGSAWYTGHFWSLAVEEHFYLLWPAILGVVGIARGARAALTLAFCVLAWRIADGHYDFVAHFVPAWHGNRFRTDYCIGELFWGCFLAYAWHSDVYRATLKKFLRSYWTVGIFAALAILLHYHPRWHEGGAEMLIALLPLVTVADPEGMVSRILETPVLCAVGRLSYSLYLWQQLFLPPPWALQILGTIQRLPFNLMAVFATAAFSYYAIERPFIRFGRRLQSGSGITGGRQEIPMQQEVQAR